jgi:flagellar hook protein FlgE
MQIGLGTSIGSIDTVMTQGLSQRTDRSLDLMIQGEGFFIVADSSGTYFTRAGNVDIDADMNLHINGMRLQGWLTNESGPVPVVETGPVKDINLGGPKQFVEPKSTTEIIFDGNLSVDGLINNRTIRTMSFTDTLGNDYTVDVQYTYHGNHGTAPNPIHGIWTYEFVRDANPPHDVIAYRGGERTNPANRVPMGIGVSEAPTPAAGPPPAIAGAALGAMMSVGVLVFDTHRHHSAGI